VTDKKISELPNAASLDGSETVPNVQIGVTTKVTLTTIAQWILKTFTGFIQSGTGAIARAFQDKAREIVSVDDFGAVGDGVTNDTPYFQAAVDSIGALGGTVHFSGRHRIQTNLTIPANVALVGPTDFAVMSGSNFTLSDNMAALLVDSTATITLSEGAGIKGALIQRYGLVWNVTAAEASAALADFAGTAVTAGVSPTTPGPYDCFLYGCFIAGFNQAFTSYSAARVNLAYVYGDCNSGIKVDRSMDKTVIYHCHFWPYFTQKSGSPAADQLRPGTAFEFTGVSSYGSFNECFSFGYYRGFVIDDASDCTLTVCGADGYTVSAGTIGFLISGNSAGNHLLGCVTSGCETGYYFDSTNVLGNTLTAAKSFNTGGVGTGVVVNDGNVNITGGNFYNILTGIRVTNATSKVSIENIQLSYITNGITADVSTNLVYVGDGIIYENVSIPVGTNIKSNVHADGFAVIVTGTNSVQVAHGLPSVPLAYNCTPVSTNLGGRDFWMSADATLIYLNVSSNVASNATFCWQARTIR